MWAWACVRVCVCACSCVGVDDSVAVWFWVWRGVWARGCVGVVSMFPVFLCLFLMFFGKGGFVFQKLKKFEKLKV